MITVLCSHATTLRQPNSSYHRNISSLYLFAWWRAWSRVNYYCISIASNEIKIMWKLYKANKIRNIHTEMDGMWIRKKEICANISRVQLWHTKFGSIKIAAGNDFVDWASFFKLAITPLCAWKIDFGWERRNAEVISLDMTLIHNNNYDDDDDDVFVLIT